MIKLNIGCGPNPLSGWVNTDLHPQTPGVKWLDATQRFPCPDAAFDRIFTEHMIEHVPYAAGRAMLAECYRVLKPDGRIRISTPDLAFIEKLISGEFDDTVERYVYWACENFCPGAPPHTAQVVNNFVRAWGHQFIYSADCLSRAMHDVGFTGPHQFYKINESDDVEFRSLENSTRMPEGFLQLETMTVEAQKGA